MTENTQATLLRRMTRLQDAEVAESPLTTSRAVRLALTKSANDTIGLILTVQSVAEEDATLDDMLGALDPALMLVSLTRDGVPVGIAGLDIQMRSAIVEMQTIGALIGQKAAERAATNTDAAMSEALLDGFLAAFPQAVKGTAFEGWGDGVTLGGRFNDARAAGLILQDCRYRIIKLRVDLGVAEREGLLLITLPLIEVAAPVKSAKPAPVDWHSAFQDTIAEAPTNLNAVLHEFALPLATIDNLTIGQALPLPGCTVESVRLMSADGDEVAQAKLGQIGGMRAVRLQPKPVPLMSDLATSSAADVPEISAPDPMLDANAEPQLTQIDVAAPEIDIDVPEVVAETDFDFVAEALPDGDAT